MDLLMCTEVLYQDQNEDDLGLGGLRSLPDPALLTDSRVLENVLQSQNVHTSNIIDYFSNGAQQQIKPHMRKIVTEWMLEVSEEEKCSPEVFSLAVNYMDRVLSQVNISKHQFHEVNLPLHLGEWLKCDIRCLVQIRQWEQFVGEPQGANANESLLCRVTKRE